MFIQILLNLVVCIYVVAGSFLKTPSPNFTFQAMAGTDFWTYSLQSFLSFISSCNTDGSHFWSFIYYCYIYSLFFFFSFFFIEPCDRGYFSKDGIVPCQACSRGQYQPTRHATSCMKCPGATTTHMEASTGLDQCRSEPQFLFFYCFSAFFFNN